MLRISALLMLAAGCKPTVQIYAPSADPAVPGIVAEAGEIWGVRTKLVDEPGRGVVSVEIRKQSQDKCGRARSAFGAETIVVVFTDGLVDCTPELWSCADVTFLTHELGHTFGLSHRGELDDPEDAPARGGVMHPAPDKGALPGDDQRLIVQTTAEAWNRLCRQQE